MGRKTLWMWITAGTLAASVLLPAVSYADKLSQAKSKLDQLNNSTKATKQYIATLTVQEQHVQGQIGQLQDQITHLQSSITYAQAQIYRRNRQIAQLKTEIATTQKKMNAQYTVLQQRVRVMYEAGQASYFDVLFSATSFADLLDRLQLLSLIAQQDRQVLQDIRTTQQHLQQSNARLQRVQATERSAYVTFLNQQSQQQNAQTRERSLLQTVHDKKLNEQAALQAESSAMSNLQSLIQQLQAQEGQYNGPSDGWVWPVPGHYTITSPYGWRAWNNEFHNGIDIGAPLGTPIVAATGGKVLYAGPASGFGDWIVIESGGSLLEIYGHMYSYEIKVAPGQIVKAGQQIAGVGDNGFSTGPHLHFTIATGFNSSGYPVSVDPTKYVHQ